MNENEKNTNPGEMISEEQLNTVSGGGIGWDIAPYRSSRCWFVADGMPREDGRTKCKTHCLGNFEVGEGKPVDKWAPGDWYICNCWGTDNCIDEWHKPCGKPARTNW